MFVEITLLQIPNKCRNVVESGEIHVMIDVVESGGIHVMID